MNWIERLYEIQKLCRKDPYSQNGEGIYLEYIFHNLPKCEDMAYDIGGGDGVYLSNTRHLKINGWKRRILDKEKGIIVTKENVNSYIDFYFGYPSLISVDVDGNDYWIIESIFSQWQPFVMVSEFNAAFTDSRTIKYNPSHVWDGTDYYGFSFEAGKKLAEAHGYKVIFQNDNLNMYMVRADLIEGLKIPEVKYEQVKSFAESDRTDWVFI